MLIPKGYGQTTDASAVASLDDIAAVPNGASCAMIQAETHDIRWRDDGIDPTATVGMLIKAGDFFFYNGSLKNFRLIEVASHATVNISYYG